MYLSILSIGSTILPIILPKLPLFQLQTAISHILPKQTSSGLSLGGRGLHVVYLDLDYKFDIFRMSNLLQNKVEGIIRPEMLQESNHTRTEDILEIVTGAFEKLHVFSCKSGAQLAATLKILATDFVPQLYNTGEMLGLVILDNITAYWDMLNDLRQGYQHRLTRTSYLETVMKSLSEIQQVCEIPIMISRRLRGTGQSDEKEPDINRAWKDFTTKSIHLEKLGKSLSAKCQTAVRYKMRWVKPDIQYEISYQIQPSSGIGIPT